MKKTFFSLSLLVVMGFMAACSTKVELYADYKDVPVIYGLIDVTQDTNFIKIVRAFSGSNDNPVDASQVALIPDSSNYPGKLDARIVEYKTTFGNQYSPTGREIILDTLTIHDKQLGEFYAPDQKVYYTTEKFNTDAHNAKYKYELVIYKSNDTVTSETSVVGGENFKILTTTVTFSPTGQDKTGKVTFIPADNAAVYEVKMVFHYTERKMTESTFTDKQVSWSYGAMGLDDDNLEGEGNAYFIKYNQATLFNMLASAIGGDTLNYERYIGDFNIYLAAGGSELFNYIEINSPTEGLSQTIPDYTNINGGFGVFSSRINLVSTVRLSARTQTDLLGMNWGFKQRD